MTMQRFHSAVGVVLTAAALAACESADRPLEGQPASETAAESPSDAFVVEVAAVDYAFQAPAEIPSGWTTFRMENLGEEHHFLLLNRLPEGKTFEDYGREVGALFDSVWDSLQTGAMDKAEAGAMLGRLLPDWYAAVEQMGGPGLVAPGRVARTAVNLEPGTYVMECYVKTPEGEFHASLGMVRPITVTTELSGAPAPAAGIEARLTNSQIAIEGEITPGEHTIAVQFTEHPELGLGNDLHLARLDEETALEEVVNWMDWMNVDGLRAPAPAEFVGGAQEVPVGHTTYFTVDLEPGRYAWISEASAERGMVKEVTVE
ncbi:MAG TPA: hypothetical protein VM737_10625 [Gemmatimonadota bacterium]|nr:hypothetical protein [Gemmatimonadota bacterium]